MTITSTTLLRDITLEDIPQGDGKIFALPGAQPARNANYENLLSPRQLGIIVSFAKDTLDNSLTWAQGVEQLRKRFRVDSADRDFAMVNSIIELGHKAAANNRISFEGRQGKMLSDMIDALAGTKPHWWEPIQKAINADAMRQRRNLLALGFAVQTNSDLSEFVFKFTRAFGKVPTPQEREHYTEGQLGVPAGIEGDVVVPTTDSGEPF